MAKKTPNRCGWCKKVRDAVQPLRDQKGSELYAVCARCYELLNQLHIGRQRVAELHKRYERAAVIMERRALGLPVTKAECEALIEEQRRKNREDMREIALVRKQVSAMIKAAEREEMKRLKKIVVIPQWMTESEEE